MTIRLLLQRRRVVRYQCGMETEPPYLRKTIVVPPAKDDGRAALRDAFMSLDLWETTPGVYLYLSIPCDCDWCREKSRT